MGGDNQKGDSSPLQKTFDGYPPKKDSLSRIEEMITFLMKTNEDLEDKFDRVENLSVHVLYSMTTTLHLIQAQEEEINDTIEKDTTYSLYRFLMDDWLEALVRDPG